MTAFLILLAVCAVLVVLDFVFDLRGRFRG